MSLQSSTRTFMIYLVLGLALIFAGLVAWTQVKAREIAALYPPTGEMIDVGGYNLHAVHIPRPDTADLPPLVFIHGASGNLRDQLIPFRDKFEGRAEMLFIDRPGHGWSDRGGSEKQYPRWPGERHRTRDAGQGNNQSHHHRPFLRRGDSGKLCARASRHDEWACVSRPPPPIPGRAE